MPGHRTGDCTVSFRSGREPIRNCKCSLPCWIARVPHPLEDHRSTLSVAEAFCAKMPNMSNETVYLSANRSPTILDDLEAGEEPLSLSKARRDKRICIDGRPHDLSWIYRAAKSGCIGQVGTRIKLETITFAGKNVTTRSAIGRFIARQAGIDPEATGRAGDGAAGLPNGVAHAAAKRRLAAAGL